MHIILSTLSELICLFARLLEQGTEEPPLFAPFNDIFAAVDVLSKIRNDCYATLAYAQVKEANISFQSILSARKR